jgi:hypothetical protein
VAISRFDIDSAVDRLGFVNGRGHLWGFPNNAATANLTTGVPINGLIGWAPGAIWYNFKATVPPMFYINQGTSASSLWTPLDVDTSSLIVLLTAASTLTAFQSGKTLLLNAAGGFTTTLQAATGSGAMYNIRVLTVSTAYVISTNGTDVYKGWVHNTAVGSIGTDETFSTTTLKNITLNGTTQGGLTIGDSIYIQDVASGVWMVNGFVTGSGTLATPFS